MLMPGRSTLLGIRHSFIAVSVGKPYEFHEYVIEKADPPSFPTGVYVSHWGNVRCSIEDPPINILQMCIIVSNKRVVMSDLIEAVIDLRPYHVAQRDCPHGALSCLQSLRQRGAQGKTHAKRVSRERSVVAGNNWDRCQAFSFAFSLWECGERRRVSVGESNAGQGAGTEQRTYQQWKGGRTAVVQSRPSATDPEIRLGLFRERGRQRPRPIREETS